MQESILNCITISIKKSFFFIYILSELILIFSSNKKSKIFDNLIKKELRFNVVFNSPEVFSEFISSFSRHNIKVDKQKNFYNDSFKLLLQKLIFVLLSSFPSSIKNESDFEYLSTGMAVFFIKFSDNFIRFTGVLILSAIVNVFETIYIKKKKADIGRKLKKILTANSFKELSILGKINSIKSDMTRNSKKPLFFFTENISKNPFVSMQDVFLFVKWGLKTLKKESCKNKLSSYELYNNIFILCYNNLKTSFLYKDFVSKTKIKKNLQLILINEESYKIFSELTYIIFLYLIRNTLKQKVNSFFHIFFFFTNYSSSISILTKHDHGLLNEEGLLKSNKNELSKMLALLEATQKSLPFFWFQISLKKILFIFSIRNKKNRLLATKIENAEIKLIEFLKKFFRLYCPSTLAFNLKLSFTFRNNLIEYPVRVLLAQKKNISVFNFWLNDQSGKTSNPRILNFLKKTSTNLFIFSYLECFIPLMSSNFSNQLNLEQLLFFSSKDLSTHFLNSLFFMSNTKKYPKNIIFTFFFLMRLAEYFNCEFRNLFWCNKIKKRKLKSQSINFEVKKKIFFTLILKTQNLPLKISLVSRKIRFTRLDNENKRTLNLLKSPLFLSLYLSLLLQVSRKKKKFPENPSFFFSIRESEYSEIIDFLLNVEKKMDFFCLENKIMLLHNFFFGNLTLKICFDGSKKRKMKLTGKKIKNFFIFKKEFLNKQLDGNVSQFTEKNIFKKKNGKKLETSSRFISNVSKFKILFIFHQKRSFFFSARKELIYFILNLPFKTTLNRLQFI